MGMFDELTWDAPPQDRPEWAKVFQTNHQEVKFTPYYPIIEGWDFGEEKPAVVWWQYLRHRAAITGITRQTSGSRIRP